MNAPDEPLSEPVLDELLSADLDGELAAAAADLGLPIEQAREAISSPAAVARRAALAAASDTIGTLPPLDDDASERLVTTAITRGRQDDDLGAARLRRERRTDVAHRVLIAAGSAAALIAVIVGLSRVSTSSSADKSAGQAATAAPNDRGSTGTGGSFGDVANPEQLRRRVAARLNVPAPTNAEFAQPTVDSAQAPGFQTGSTTRTASDSPRDQTLRKLATCTSGAQRAAAASGAPLLSGAGRYRGSPAYFFVYRRAGGRVAIVVDRADCRVITRVPVP
jgi:hypothetical protein